MTETSLRTPGLSAEPLPYKSSFSVEISSLLSMKRDFVEFAETEIVNGADRSFSNL
jgi:hypothetical protein